MTESPLRGATWLFIKSVSPFLGEWRVLYVARFAGAVYVLHAFQKKAQKTRREDIDLARQRYRQIEE